ncbi:CHAT domain-containing protein [Actinoplanes sp. NBRC 101535]|uniref:CHAT domain-containing protein n=1 Tax=Actinoplanes sp. NBRC 101535 TaxID=3032196 RepID=UPI0024A519C9|nr:CHAT domain-containing protein [Actinoplanes sp. NBRC 101535]GLY06166.1 hypothetical protein Acsp01_65450 [Actinoplanes sp. NBRC 101535]
MNRMAVLELEIFEQSSTYCELRLSTGDGPPLTRGLERGAVDELITLVDRDYGPHSTAQKVFGATRLTELGERLARFLDGEERWLSRVLSRPEGAVLRITAEERLRHLPWELLVQNGTFLVTAGRSPVLPVRAVAGDRPPAAPVVPANRPLRVLFMATSPEGVEPVLSFEAEEAAILTATRRTGTDLVVEESGTLEGLRILSRSYDNGHFDILHLSGHATTDGGRPVFVVENEYGAPATATAEDIAEAMRGNWPRLVFLSGCLTGDAPDAGALPSMSESLVEAGAPAVLGWALPVGDITATAFAAELYASLADGRPLDEAVTDARRHLHQKRRSPNWHLLRVFADRAPLAPMVTPLRTPRRARPRIRAVDQQFLDPQTQVSRVASRTEFVGRRRVVQRCLRVLTESVSQALVLHGMGGLGKSSLASRLLERMHDHQRAVWYGRVDLTRFRELTTKIHFDSLSQQIEATKILGDDQVPLAVRLRYLFDGPLATTPCLFVFDDFEQGNLDPLGDDGHVTTAAMSEILTALLTAIRESESPSRVIITSRYRFPAPAGTGLVTESLESLTDLELEKKLANLKNLNRESSLDTTIRDRAIDAAAGNPRLLDWLDRIVADRSLDVGGLLAAIEAEADRFREAVLAGKLLESQPIELRTMLAKVNVIELPVPAATVHALHDHVDAARHIDRAVQLGLLEQGTDSGTSEPRYHVSNVLRPLVRMYLTDDEYARTCAAAARSLFQHWVLDPAAPRVTP